MSVNHLMVEATKSPAKYALSIIDMKWEIESKGLNQRPKETRRENHPKRMPKVEAGSIKGQSPQMLVFFHLPILRLLQALSLGAVIHGLCMFPFMSS